MAQKYLLFDLDDEKAKKLGEVISNVTCKKIVNFLAEKDASESDIAKELGMPVNTVEYNLKKLLDAGIIEKSKDYFWSRKGKKIDMYKVANKLIVIAPKKGNVYSKLKGIVPAVLITGILAGIVYFYQKSLMFARDAVSQAEESVVGVVKAGGESLSSGVASVNVDAGISGIISSLNSWEWFLLGAWLAIIIFLVWNWRKL